MRNGPSGCKWYKSRSMERPYIINIHEALSTALCAFVRCVCCACAALTYTMRSSSTSPTTHP